MTAATRVSSSHLALCVWRASHANPWDARAPLSDAPPSVGTMFDLHICYSNRKTLTLACLWLLLGLGMAFSITSFDSIGKCYTVPCVSAMEEIMKVNNGLSLTLLLTGFLFILQPVYGIWFMRVRCSQLVGGASR